jgi:hypothetical protein
LVKHDIPVTALNREGNGASQNPVAETSQKQEPTQLWKELADS